MFLEETGMSCGVRNINGLSPIPEKTLLDVYSKEESFAFLQWSDVWGRYENGNKLYHFIRKHFPRSSVQRTKPLKNPNSTNKICIYTWRVPKNFKNWCVKVKKKGNTYSPCDSYCSTYGCDC